MWTLAVMLSLVLAGCAWEPPWASPSEPPESSTARVTFFRATLPGHHGSGATALLQGSDFVVVVDTGFPLDQERAVPLVPLLRDRGVEHIDVLVGTHPHGDHIGQHGELLGAFPVDEVWMAGHDFSHHADPSWHAGALADATDAIEASQADYLEPRARHGHEVGSLTLEVLYPRHLMSGHADHWEINQDSLVIRATYGDVRLLLTGDAGHLSEGLMLGAGVDVEAEILELGHHGVGDSTTRPFVEAVSPQVAVWSGDHEHVPDPAVVETVLRTAPRLYGTAAHGHVTVTTDGREFSVETEVGVDAFETLAQWERWWEETHAGDGSR